MLSAVWSGVWGSLACIAVLLGTASSASITRATAGSTSIKLLQWNPHWQCWGNTACAGNASAALTSLLTTKDLDFANVIELEAPFAVPHGWGVLGAYDSCGGKYGDWDTLFYDSSKWKLVNNETACMYSSRSFTLGVFSSVATPGLTVVAVGAHYPQTQNASTHAYENSTATLAAAIKTHTASLTNPKVVLMADTNTEGPEAAKAPGHAGVNKTNGQILHDLGVWADPAADPPGAPLYKGCCGGDTPPYAWQGDRIVANFGAKNPSATVLFDPAPVWTDFPNSEFHKGVMINLVLQ